MQIRSTSHFRYWYVNTYYEEISSKMTDLAYKLNDSTHLFAAISRAFPDIDFFKLSNKNATKSVEKDYVFVQKCLSSVQNSASENKQSLRKFWKMPHKIQHRSAFNCDYW